MPVYRHRERIFMRFSFLADTNTLLYWFTAIHLITATKKTFSALEMQRQLGHKRYQPIWEMMHKLRSVMGTRDDKYKLKDTVELDEGFFTCNDERQATSTSDSKEGHSKKVRTIKSPA